MTGGADLGLHLAVAHSKYVAIQDCRAETRHNILTQTVSFGLHLGANNYGNKLLLFIEVQAMTGNR